MSAPTECRADGRCQYAIDHGAEGLGCCPRGKCSMPALWCIYIPGPCEVHAAPSKAAAEHMAARHNEAMTRYFERYPERAPEPLAWTRAEVREWPHDEEAHADALAEFDAAAWGWKGDA